MKTRLLQIYDRNDFAESFKRNLIGTSVLLSYMLFPYSKMYFQPGAGGVRGRPLLSYLPTMLSAKDLIFRGHV